MSGAGRRIAGALAAATVAIALGVLAAWPIYETLWLCVVGAAGLVLGAGVGILGGRRLRPFWAAALLFLVFAVTVVPIAVPSTLSTLPAGLPRGLIDGIAGVVLGWKQLLTLTLPVGSYRAVLVPAYVVFLLTAYLTVMIALRAPRWAAFAALPLVAPVAFGTLFGATQVSEAVAFGPLQVTAPRELLLWGLAAALAAVWVWWTSGAERRAALRRGRIPGERRRTAGSTLRRSLGAATLLIALAAGALWAPTLATGARQVPRDAVDPEIVLRERPSPLAAYRTWKRDATIDAELFSVTSSGELPGRMRLAVLDHYDGVDFRVSDGAAGRFTRFPSTPALQDTAQVTVRIGDAYRDIWVPTAPLGSVPVFTGPRAAELGDSLFVNRDTGAAIAVPGGAGSTGLTAGDGLRAEMRYGADPALTAGPAGSADPQLREQLPELSAWISAQQQPNTAAGLTELLKRLRERGYLSHALSERERERAWLDRLSAQYGLRFVTSTAGQSVSRIEQLFAQLNTQQRLAGDTAAPQQLVAGIGDDEQFAAAAALIARALGYDSRVVLGVRLGATAEVPGVPHCDVSCTGDNLAAWIEVRGDAGAWAPIDVSPQVELFPTTLEEGEQLPEHPSIPEQQDAHEVDPPLGLGEEADAVDPQPEQVGLTWLLPLLRAVGLSLTALVCLLLPLLFLPAMKRRRRKQRAADADPELMTLGAWAELVDTARDFGVRVPANANRSEVAELLGTPAARAVAQAADQAVFSPRGASAAEADVAWSAVRTERAERIANATRWGRIRAQYSLASYAVWQSEHRSKKNQMLNKSATLARRGK